MLASLAKAAGPHGGSIIPLQQLSLTPDSETGIGYLILMMSEQRKVFGGAAAVRGGFVRGAAL